MKKDNLRPGIIGKDGRTSAIENCLRKSKRVVGEPVRLSDWKVRPAEKAKEEVLRRARKEKPDFVIIGPEEPLAEGVVDALEGQLGIPCIGPSQSLARLESSKAFTRELLSKYGIPGNPRFKIFQTTEGIEEYLKELVHYVVKPDGLTGGKGVKLSDAHLFSTKDAVTYCEELFGQQHRAVVIEEKLDGEEFSLQSFCDGRNVVDMVVVQDHKRACDGDAGPNTGGMGSYSCADHSLPFLLPSQVREASEINARVARALLEETRQPYKGVLYGGFMATRNGIRVLEYNARFGDPETLNVLSLLKTDFVDICEAIIDGKLDGLSIDFERRASVCKYVVPEGYPDNPVKGKCIDLKNVPKESEKLRIYRAALEERDGESFLTGSRAIAFVGIGDTLEEAQAIAEQAASAVKGPVTHRKDIGTHELIQRRITHMKDLFSKEELLP